MIIWKEQKAKLISQTIMPVTLINNVARVCYKSLTPGDEDKQLEFIKKLIEKGHESPLEFIDFIFFLQTNRAIANELVRHRIASYMQESTRYVQYENLEMIKTPELVPNSLIEDRLQSLFIQYQSMIKDGTRKEMARDLLPLGMVTHMYMKMNLRELRHFIKLRGNKAAHPMMRQLVNLMVAELYHANSPKRMEAFLYGIPSVAP